MALTFHNLKKWWLMVNGKSILHVNQDEGKCFSVNEVKGYYNNLTAKVLNSGIIDNSIPIVTVDVNNQAKTIVMTTAVFQYALGAYDLFLLNEDKGMLERALVCAEWALDVQQKNGGWLTFDYVYPEAPYSAMSVGEGISLLCRAYIATNEDKYKVAAEKALSYLTTPLDKGGVCSYDNNGISFFECTNQSLILNGWIFAYWGVYDFWLLFKSPEVKVILDSATKALANSISIYDKKYWSRYNLSGMISSPFYHRLHIAQLNVLYMQTGEVLFKHYADKWASYLSNPMFKLFAFVAKALQKIKE